MYRQQNDYERQKQLQFKIKPKSFLRYSDTPTWYPEKKYPVDSL